MNSLHNVPIELDEDEESSFPQTFVADKSISYLVCSYPFNPHPDLGFVEIINGLAFRLEAPNQFNDALIYFGVMHYCLEGIKELHGLEPSVALDNVHFFSTQLFTMLKIGSTLTPQARYKSVYNWAHPTPIFKKKIYCSLLTFQMYIGFQFVLFARLWLLSRLKSTFPTNLETFHVY